MKTLREYIDQLDEISRRDFLKGAGATAGLAAMGGAKADWQRDPDQVDKMTDQVYKSWSNVSTDGLATLVFHADNPTEHFSLKHNQGIWQPQGTYGRLKVDNGPVVDIQFTIASNTRKWVGIAAAVPQLFGPELKKIESYILSAKKQIKIDVTSLTRTNELILIFNVQPVQEELDEQASEDAVKRIEQLVQYK